MVKQHKETLLCVSINDRNMITIFYQLEKQTVKKNDNVIRDSF